MSRSKLLAIAWFLLISILSHGFVDSRSFVHGVSQVSNVSEAGFSTFWKDWWWLFVKGWHVTEFFVLTLLIQHALKTWRILVAPMLAIVAAALDEWHQTFVPHRGGLLSDVAVDMIGILLATIWLSTRRPGSKSLTKAQTS